MKKIIALILIALLSCFVLCACADKQPEPQTRNVPEETVEKIVEDLKTGKAGALEKLSEGDELDLRSYSQEERETVKQALTEQGVTIRDNNNGKVTVVTVPAAPDTPSTPEAQDTPTDPEIPAAPDTSDEPGYEESDEQVHIDTIPDNPDE